MTFLNKFYLNKFIILKDVGAGRGRYYAVNCPLRDGIDDETYERVFQPIMEKVG